MSGDGELGLLVDFVAAARCFAARHKSVPLGLEGLGPAARRRRVAQLVRVGAVLVGTVHPAGVPGCGDSLTDRLVEAGGDLDAEQLRALIIPAGDERLLIVLGELVALAAAGMVRR